LLQFIVYLSYFFFMSLICFLLDSLCFLIEFKHFLIPEFIEFVILAEMSFLDLLFLQNMKKRDYQDIASLSCLKAWIVPARMPNSFSFLPHFDVWIWFQTWISFQTQLLAHRVSSLPSQLRHTFHSSHKPSNVPRAPPYEKSKIKEINYYEIFLWVSQFSLFFVPYMYSSISPSGSGKWGFCFFEEELLGLILFLIFATNECHSDAYLTTIEKLTLLLVLDCIHR